MITEADYHARAIAHRPTRADEMRAAARRMAAEGHGEATIASALGLHVAAVQRLLGEPSP